jgi:cytochrome c-type biogenesis protein CcmH/NrfF
MQRLKNNLGAYPSRDRSSVGRTPWSARVPLDPHIPKRVRVVDRASFFLGRYLSRDRKGAVLFLVFVLAASALAQTVSEKPTADVRRVGARLQCQCGCKDSVATCSMLECSFSKPAKERIARMQAAGFSDTQIVQAFVRDSGAGIYLAPPSAFGWIVPYVSIAFGLVVIWGFVKKYRKPKPLADLGSMQVDDPALEQYKERIEEDLKKLD